MPDCDPARRPVMGLRCHTIGSRDRDRPGNRAILDAAAFKPAADLRREFGRAPDFLKRSSLESPCEIVCAIRRPPFDETNDCFVNAHRVQFGMADRASKGRQRATMVRVQNLREAARPVAAACVYIARAGV
jgi:hypothetical protein